MRSSTLMSASSGSGAFLEMVTTTSPPMPRLPLLSGTSAFRKPNGLRRLHIMLSISARRGHRYAPWRTTRSTSATMVKFVVLPQSLSARSGIRVLWPALQAIAGPVLSGDLQGSPVFAGSFAASSRHVGQRGAGFCGTIDCIPVLISLFQGSLPSSGCSDMIPRPTCAFSGGAIIGWCRWFRSSGAVVAGSRSSRDFRSSRFFQQSSDPCGFSG